MDDSFHSLIVETRKRNTKRMRMAEIMAVMFAVLLLGLHLLPAARAGLGILLGSYLITIFVVLYRNARLAKDLRQPSIPTRADVVAWFEREEAFLKWWLLLEHTVRLAAIGVLAYGFWQATRNPWLVFGISFAYPTAAWYDVMRHTTGNAAQQLRKRKDEITYKL